ncbi:uroporphyrinogen-III C-methyltransferase [Chromobacterium sp. TRC.1.1.SA]|uniref:uroporphyrinogen-III C-methyltransferase n=1 Tax=Chromobacterium indicum TaxID=3110228 RepID=A0ABV0CJ57_9NEIS
MTGKVYLIGAGPGDLDMLTLKAARCLKLADVALVDDLVHPDIRAMLRPDAEIVPVGKRGGCPSTPQAAIEQRMIDEARAGKTVARLKGGDPFVFGRGGEEMLTLQAAGIEVEIVNGLSAGLAVPATLGIPLTHRSFVHGVTFVSGHPHQDGDEPNWQALAQSGMTLVIYMGVKRLPLIRAELLRHGLAADTPAAAIENGTLPQQRQVLSTLGALEQDMSAAGIHSPALIVIGPTVALASCSPSALERSEAPLQGKGGGIGNEPKWLPTELAQ